MNTNEMFQLHEKVCRLSREIIEQKNQDYTSGKGSTDVFSNFRGSINFGVDPEIAIMVRIQDKFKRLEAMVRIGSHAVKSESIYDTAADIINYTVFIVGLLEERIKWTEFVPLATPIPFETVPATQGYTKAVVIPAGYRRLGPTKIIYQHDLWWDTNKGQFVSVRDNRPELIGLEVGEGTRIIIRGGVEED